VAESGARAVAAILRKPVLFPELCAVLVAVLDTPADWAEPPGPPLRGQIIYRLVTEGSNALVRQVCLRLEEDRTPRWGAPASALPGWSDLARLAQREGLLSKAEGTLLAAEPAVLVESR
jgi:hypothetical protein